MTTEEVGKQIQELLKKNNLIMKSKISFPIYNILPDEVVLALKILDKHGMKVTTILTEKK